MSVSLLFFSSLIHSFLGTGKTTAARKFGKVFFNLDLLPTDRIIETTGKTMLGQFVGQTETLVTEKMKEAKGGILFIDEAYGLFPSRGSYGGDALQALLDNMTKPEFKGNLIVILAGYDKHIDALFGVNPGLKSRFDKIRLPFPSWTAQQAADASFRHIERDNKTITDAAKKDLFENYQLLCELPDWSSARDIYETILPAMYTYRAERLSQHAAATAKLTEGGARAATQKIRSVDGSVVPLSIILPPYDVSDVNGACTSMIANRRKGLQKIGGNLLNEIFTTRDGGDDSEDAAASGYPPCAPAPAQKAVAPMQGRYKHKTLEKDPTADDGGDGESGIPGLMAKLEEACAEKGYDPTVMEKFLDTGNLPKDLVELVWSKNGGAESKYDVGQIRTALVKQSAPLLTKIRTLLKQMAEFKSAEEKKKQEKLQKIGKCCMGFEWLKVEGGYRCAGGSHYCSNEEVDKFQL